MREKIIRIVAGLLVLLSVTLAYTVSEHWLWLAVFVGVNLFQSALTSFCPLEIILKKMNIE